MVEQGRIRDGEGGESWTCQDSTKAKEKQEDKKMFSKYDRAKPPQPLPAPRMKRSELLGKQLTVVKKT